MIFVQKEFTNAFNHRFCITLVAWPYIIGNYYPIKHRFIVRKYSTKKNLSGLHTSRITDL